MNKQNIYKAPEQNLLLFSLLLLIILPALILETETETTRNNPEGSSLVSFRGEEVKRRRKRKQGEEEEDQDQEEEDQEFETRRQGEDKELAVVEIGNKKAASKIIAAIVISKKESKNNIQERGAKSLPKLGLSSGYLKERAREELERVRISSITYIISSFSLFLISPSFLVVVSFPSPSIDIYYQLLFSLSKTIKNNFLFTCSSKQYLKQLYLQQELPLQYTTLYNSSSKNNNYYINNDQDVREKTEHQSW